VTIRSFKDRAPRRGARIEIPKTSRREVKTNRKIISAAMSAVLVLTVLAAIVPNTAAEPDTKTYKIAWLMIIDWDSDYPAAPYYLSIHPDKPSDWTITYTSVWFDDIQGGECIAANYDMIVTTGHEHYTFTPQQRSILEEYVRSGGVLWFDDCGDIEMDNMPFGYDVNFGNENYPPWGYAYNSPTNHDFTIDQPTHPLMDGQFTIDYDHIRDDRSTTRWFSPFLDWDPHYEVVLSGLDQGRGLSGPAVLAAQVGYGKIVATALDVTCALEADDYGGWPATRFDFHLVMNMLAWSTQPTFKYYNINWITPSEGAEFSIGSTVPLEFVTTDNLSNPVDDSTAFIEAWKGPNLIKDDFSIAISNGHYTASWDTTGMDEGEYTLLADFEGYCSQEPVKINLVAVIPPTADAGSDIIVYEGDTVLFNGTGSVDPDGTIISYHWEFGDGDTGSGPMPTHIYGDDGVYTATLTVTDNDDLTDSDTCVITVLNVDPEASIDGAYIDVEIGLRVAGRKFNDVGLTLYEDGIPIGYVSIERMPGSPDDQMAWIPMRLDMTRGYAVTVTYIPEEPPNIGSNPIWLYVMFENGSMESVHHTFNVQQSKIRDSDHWNHVEPWEVDVNELLIGHMITLEASASDPGSDDLGFKWDFELLTTWYRNDGTIGTIPTDLYPSPGGLFPFLASHTATYTYSGPETLSLIVTDDDGGITNPTITLG
jgi:hypothetical protein